MFHERMVLEDVLQRTEFTARSSEATTPRLLVFMWNKLTGNSFQRILFKEEMTQLRDMLNRLLEENEI